MTWYQRKIIADYYEKKGKKVENDQKWNCFRNSNESEIIYVLTLSAVFTFLSDKLIANFMVRSQMKKCSKIMKIMVKI